MAQHVLIDVVLIGNVVREYVVRSNHRTGPVLGSPAAYTSLALVKQGMRPGIVSFCDKDFRGVVEEKLISVDLTGCLDYIVTTEDHLIYLKKQRNRVEYFKKAPVIYSEVIPEDYLSAPAFFICPMDYEVSADLMTDLSEAGRRLYIDLGGFGGTTSYNHFPASSKKGQYLLDKICRAATFVKASSDDLRYLYPDDKEESAARKLIDRGAEGVLITMAEHGALCVLKDGQSCYAPAYVRDAKKLYPTGCGDILTAGFIAGIERGFDPQTALEYGSAAAAYALTREGWCEESRMPTVREIEALMAEKRHA